MPDLVVIVPSRGRPERAHALAVAFTATCTADTGLVFAVDNDDPACLDYLRIVQGQFGRHAYATDPPSTMVIALNNTARWVTELDAAPFAVAFMGDDHM